jgi:cytochrome c oxidase cbb3-type subunit 2
VHLGNPRVVVPESNMPGYPWLTESEVNPEEVVRKMRVLKMLGDPYTDAEIEAARDELKGKLEIDALIAYLQGLGTNLREK